MKSDLMIALTQLATERNLPKEVVVKTVETALASAFRREYSIDNQQISVKIVPQTGEIRVYVPKTIVDETSNPHYEIALTEARRLHPEACLGETIEVLEPTPTDAGRIAAQTVKQVVLQRLREAEQDAIFEGYTSREGTLISGEVQRIEPRQSIISFGRVEAILPLSEQVSTERYRIGQRLKLYLLEVLHANKGPQLIMSRSHPNLLKCLFELEVPEIRSGIVEIKALARESGYRSKVAVATSQKGVDPVGCCVGLRGIRIQNITRELNGEKIDVIEWSSSVAKFIANALSPAPTVKVGIVEDGKSATVIVPDKQLSLAIGRDGQNARLAAKLTGWRIDIKSVSEVEIEPEIGPIVEKVLTPEPELEVEPPKADEATGESIVDKSIESVLEEPSTEVPTLIEFEDVITTEDAPMDIPVDITDELISLVDYPVEMLAEEVNPIEPGSQIRFAEDLPNYRGPSRDTSSHRKSRKGRPKRSNPFKRL